MWGRYFWRGLSTEIQNSMIINPYLDTTNYQQLKDVAIRVDDHFRHVT